MIVPVTSANRKPKTILINEKLTEFKKSLSKKL
jgi:hypothetical protein